MSSERSVSYVESGGLQIAYQVIGNGPLDMVIAFEWGSNLDLAWDNPRVDRFLRRFGEYGRLITSTCVAADCRTPWKTFLR